MFVFLGAPLCFGDEADWTLTFIFLIACLVTDTVSTAISVYMLCFSQNSRLARVFH